MNDLGFYGCIALGYKAALEAFKCYISTTKNGLEQIAKLPASYVEKAYEGYQGCMGSGLLPAEPVEHKKQNAARRAANIRLREFVEKVGK